MNKLVTFLAFLSVAAMIFAISRGALKPMPVPTVEVLSGEHR